MSKEKRRVPKLRFPGFTEDWEQRKLSDILVERNEQQVETNEYPLMSFVQGHGVIPKGERYDRSFLVLDQSKKYKRTELGDFIYSSNNLETGSIGINKTGKAVISPVYSIFYGVSIGDSQFIGIMSLLPRFIAKMIRFRQGVVYGQWRIHEKDFLDISILIPSEAERTKITKLILSIEELITLHQRKLNNLKLKKKALLQKLFPKNEERYPELRFPGFTDAWEQRKLDDIAKIKTGGGTPKTTNLEYWSGDIPWIQSSDLVEGDVVHVNIKKFINNNALKNSAAKLISRDSIALVTRVGVGKVAVINQDFTTSQDFLSLSGFDGNDIKFIAYQLFRLMQENAKVLQGTSIKGITKTDLIEQSIAIPNSIKEQSLIANILSQTDSIITLHQRKLDHLQLQKKALLQQMFV